MSEVQARFDGLPIDVRAGKFTGVFDLDASSNMDDEVYFVVRTRVVGAAMSETKGGDLKRTDVYAVTGVNTLDADVGFKLQTLQEAQLVFNTNLLDGSTGELTDLGDQSDDKY